MHYVLRALEKGYGGDEDRILREVARHPENRLRYALGNGASPPDIDRFVRWLGLDDMFELYGSTEAEPVAHVDVVGGKAFSRVEPNVAPARRSRPPFVYGDVVKLARKKTRTDGVKRRRRGRNY